MPVLAFSVIPLTALVLGAIAAAVPAPSAVLTSGVQHFVAGLVFAAAAKARLCLWLSAGASGGFCSQLP